jgi:hypothetical protein
MMLGELIDVLKCSAESTNDTTESLVSHTRQDSMNRSNSLSETCGNQTATSLQGIAGNPIVNFHILIEEKLPVHARKRYEKQVIVSFVQIPFKSYNKVTYSYYRF